MKKLALLMAVVMLMALASTAMAADYKIAIITNTVSQNEEEFRSAEQLQAQYPDIVVTATFPDQFASEIEATKAAITQFAFDPDVKAIITNQAVPGVAAAFEEVREINPDILLLANKAQENAATLSPAADVVLNDDEPATGYQIIDKAHEWGADVFVHYSFPRHMAMELIVARYNIMKPLAEEYGIEFTDRTAPDPTGDAGASGAQQFILEDVPAAMEEHEGKKVAFFSTNCSMQEALQVAVLAEPNALYPLPCCPSPYHGFPASMELTGSSEAEDYSDPVGMLQQIAGVLKEHDALDRFSTWSRPFAIAATNTLFDYATLYINGDITERNDQEALAECLMRAVEANEAIPFEKYTDADGVEYDNFYVALLEQVNFNDYVIE